MAQQINNQHLDRVNGLLAELKAGADAAASSGDAFMLGVYRDLVKAVSPIAVKALARLERAEKARINRQHKDLLKSQRASSEATTEQSAS